MVKRKATVKEKKLLRKIVILATISFLISLFIFLTDILEIFEIKVYDMFSKYLNPKEFYEKIVIVQVDQQSIDTLSDEGIMWPWPRQVYAPIIEFLSEAEAIFIDILFTEPSSYGQEDDLILARAFEKASNIYLPFFLSAQQKPMKTETMDFIKGVAIENTLSPIIDFNYAIPPIEVLRKFAKGSGNVAISPDEDGIYRRIPLAFRLKEYIIPHFVLSYFNNLGTVRITQNSIYIDAVKVPLVEGRLMLRYYRKKHPFRTFSAVDILKASLDSSKSTMPQLEKDFFHGKFVFLGLTAAGLYDLKPTPISSISTGVTIHATTLSNILKKNFIKPIKITYSIALMLSICILTVWLVLKNRYIYINLLIFFLFLFVIIIISAISFKNALYINTLSPATSLLVSFIVSIVYSYASEGKERRFIKSTFSRYVDKKIVDYLLENPSLVTVGGQRKRVTVFFADMANFTTIAERITPEETAKMLYTVLNTFTEIIIQNNGVIDKYIGDCIMAFWGSPFGTEKYEVNACTAALKCIESLQDINERLNKDSIPEINMRLGIHSGDAIAGNLGSDRLFDYTVVGDTVNLAARLESANKIFKTNIIISEETYKKTGNLFSVRQLGIIEVKGKTLPITIYELVGEAVSIPSDKEELINLFHQGLHLYNKRKWQEALEIFKKILNNYRKDGPSEFYKNRCEYLVENPAAPLTKDWKIVKMEIK